MKVESGIKAFSTLVKKTSPNTFFDALNMPKYFGRFIKGHLISTRVFIALRKVT